MVNDTPVKMTFTNTGGFTADIYPNQKIENSKIQHAETYITNKPHYNYQNLSKVIEGNMLQS